MLPPLPVERVEHTTNVTSPEAGITAQYGEYLVRINDCQGCHGSNLAGGKHPDPSVSARVPNLTPGGEPGFWTQDQFMTAVRQGQTPGGHQLNPDLMPWKVYRSLSDEELQAIWLYLQSLPSTPTNP
jgi:cytochrome c553